jgi:hypothetical protein
MTGNVSELYKSSWGLSPLRNNETTLCQRKLEYMT